MSFSAEEGHGMASVWRAQAEAEIGSSELCKAMRQQFFRFAARHGVTVKDAQLFCMNAEEPR